DGDLGDRMGLAFREAFRDGLDRVIIVGTDCPDLTGPILRSAFDRLAQHDVVLGPATDGGYYLIGVRREATVRALPHILSQIDWGTEHVFGQTLAAVRAQGLSGSTLPPLDDVDHPEDLEVWKRATRDDTAPDEPAHISIIIPTLNEAAGIQDTIDCLNGADRVDVCVVDGGSDDGTPERVRKRGVPVLHSTRGRAAQMNRGAARAEGDILLFLHADTRLPTGFEEHVRIAMAQPDVSAGAFTFSTNERSLAMRAIAWMTNQRARRLGMPYGDQALFMRKHRFREIGGYPDIPIMEDFVLMRRLRRQGRIVILPECAVTSARRWNTVGKWRTTLYNQFVIVLFLIGIPPDRLARFYDRRRGTHDE
ncbi:MAG: TIGR04283 family arsenosugar biosynthesis glycosyltransferase, partial [Candidatus Hydrogenedentes bacterium]|nr:TIGR04283 family arsenosugar biosynthesis glycosyltransferase [Candidatus Hydrogenedentota bacterium]